MDPSPAHTAAYEAARRSKEISNYMVYLLFVNPEMYKQLKGIPLNNDETAPQGEKELAQNIIHRLLGTEGSDMDRMVQDAWAIANELLTSLQSNEEKLWRVVQGVWVEIIGSEHAFLSLQALFFFTASGRESAQSSPEAHQHNLGQGGGVTVAHR